MKKGVLIAVFLSTILCAANAVDIGDRLARTFLLFHSLPLNSSAAKSSGWALATDDCDPDLGYVYQAKGGYSVGNPILMYYTAAGQLAGVGIIHFAAPLPTMTKFWQNMNDSSSGNTTYLMTLHFRAPSVVCSKTAQSEQIGDRVVINQGSLNFNVPVTDKAAAAAKWAPGNCIPGMGTHWSYDLGSAPVLSYKIAQTVPVFPMYNNGAISAFFVESATFQDIEPVGVWEGPFIPALFCKNLCKACAWDSGLTSTLHFLLQDHSKISCSSPCNPFF